MNTESGKKRKSILVAPLNWGLGHTTRCIPIIYALLKSKFEVIIASDGQALKLLTKEFPKLEAIELPSYNIRYTKSKHLLKLKLMLDSPRILKAIKTEKNIIDRLVTKKNLCGIISDNRFGVYDIRIPSVIITHQLNVLSGSTSWISTKLNQRFLNPFNECWVPDYRDNDNLSGYLSKNDKLNNTKFIGILSRFKNLNLEESIEIVAVISGPEPQRSQLETTLLNELKNYKHKVDLVRGVVEDKIETTIEDNITIYNYLTTDLLQEKLNRAKMVICRSGYSSLMDLAKLKKKAFFIPTPGQYEQVYLAKRMQQLKIAAYCNQNEFSLKKLEETKNYYGFSLVNKSVDLSSLFFLFERE